MSDPCRNALASASAFLDDARPLRLDERTRFVRYVESVFLWGRMVVNRAEHAYPENRQALSIYA